MNTKSPQGRALLGRFSAHKNHLRWQKVKVAEPLEVRAARKVVQKHEQRVRSERNKYLKRVDKQAARAEETILFGTEEQALRAVKRFEKLKSL